MSALIQINSAVLANYLEEYEFLNKKDGVITIDEKTLAWMLKRYNEEMLHTYFADGALVEFRYYESDGLIFDRMARTVRIHGKEISCTPTELVILEAFFQNESHLLSRDYLVDLLSMSGSMIQDNTLSVFISGLRKKIGKSRIVSRRGVGYYWNAEVNKRKSE